MSSPENNSQTNHLIDISADDNHNVHKADDQTANRFEQLSQSLAILEAKVDAQTTLQHTLSVENEAQKYKLKDLEDKLRYHSQQLSIVALDSPSYLDSRMSFIEQFRRFRQEVDLSSNVSDDNVDSHMDKSIAEHDQSIKSNGNEHAAFGSW